MKKEETKIAFTNDIIKEVADELNISTEKVSEVYNTMLTYLKYLIEYTDAVAIFIPHIGTLHIKIWYLFERLKKLVNKPEKLKIFQRKKSILDKHIQEHIDYSYKGRSRHIERNTIDRLPYNSGKTLLEIEEIQNSK